MFLIYELLPPFPLQVPTLQACVGFTPLRMSSHGALLMQEEICLRSACRRGATTAGMPCTTGARQRRWSGSRSWATRCRTGSIRRTSSSTCPPPTCLRKRGAAIVAVNGRKS